MKRSRINNSIFNSLSKYSIYFVLLVLFIISWMANENFITPQN